MKLTPIEIRKQEFKKSMRGYDSVEVDTFLELVAAEYENLIHENENLKKQLISIESELRHFKDVEKTLKQTLYNVQETSQLSKETSQKEATLIRREAELAALHLTEEARMEVRRMKEEVAALKQQKDSFIARLRHLLSSQMELLEVLGIDEGDIAELKDRTKKAFTTQQAKKNTRSADFSSTSDTKLSSREISEKPTTQSGKISEVKPMERTKPEDTDKKKGRDFFKDIFTDKHDD